MRIFCGWLSKGAVVAMLACFAQAASSNEPASHSIEVRYDDLNLATPAGARILIRRIGGAAASVCRSLDGLGVDRVLRYHRCVREAQENALAQVRSRSKFALEAGGSHGG